MEARRQATIADDMNPLTHRTLRLSHNRSSAVALAFGVAVIGVAGLAG